MEIAYRSCPISGIGRHSYNHGCGVSKVSMPIRLSKISTWSIMYLEYQYSDVVLLFWVGIARPSCPSIEGKDLVQSGVAQH